MGGKDEAFKFDGLDATIFSHARTAINIVYSARNAKI